MVIPSQFSEELYINDITCADKINLDNVCSS